MSNTAGVLWEALTAYPSRAPEFNLGYLVGSVLLIHVVFCVVLLCVFTLRVPSCDFRIKTKFGSFWPPVVCGTAHVWVICVCLCVVVSNVVVLCFCLIVLRLVCPVLPVSLDCHCFWLHLKYSLTIIYYTYQHYCTNDSNECQLNISSLKSSYLMGIPRTNFLFPLLVTIKWKEINISIGYAYPVSVLFLKLIFPRNWDYY
jgi:hypothetical protein